MSKANNTMFFILGALTGVSASFYFIKEYYKKISNEEIASVKEVFSKKDSNHLDSAVKNATRSVKDLSNALKEPKIKSSLDRILDDDDTKNAYRKIVTKIDYNKMCPISADNEKEEMEDNEGEDLNEFNDNSIVKEPYVIAPEDFGEVGYEEVSLTYYSDGVLADDQNEVITRPNDILGPVALDSFGEYEDDSVFVRNEELKTDYEILLNLETYNESTQVIEKPPHIIDDDK